MRELIGMTLEDNKVEPTPQLIHDIYTLVIHLAARKNMAQIQRAIDEAIARVMPNGAKG